MCLVCLWQPWVTDVPVFISTHKFFHLLLLSKSERATVEAWGPHHKEELAVQSQAAGCSWGSFSAGLWWWNTSVTKARSCSRRSACCGATQMMKRRLTGCSPGYKGSLTLQLKEGQAVCAYWIGKPRENGPFLCARSQAEVSWMIKRSLTKFKHKGPPS